MCERERECSGSRHSGVILKQKCLMDGRVGARGRGGVKGESGGKDAITFSEGVLRLILKLLEDHHLWLAVRWTLGGQLVPYSGFH